MTANASPSIGNRLAESTLAFDHEPLGRVVFESGALGKLGMLVRELGGTRVLLVTDPGLEAVGHPQKAIRILREAGLEVFLFDGVEENPESRHVNAGVVAAKKNAIDFLVAIGGGSSM